MKKTVAILLLLFWIQNVSCMEMDSGCKSPRHGPPGVTGATGATGSTGVKGVTGPQGERGQKGKKGPDGPQGPMGRSGGAGDLDYLYAHNLDASGNPIFNGPITTSPTTLKFDTGTFVEEGTSISLSPNGEIFTFEIAGSYYIHSVTYTRIPADTTQSPTIELKFSDSSLNIINPVGHVPIVLQEIVNVPAGTTLSVVGLNNQARGEFFVPFYNITFLLLD